MQIQLRQTEIIEALKQYVAKQGIALQNKTVEINFTNGRKESGLTADISIEEAASLPELNSDEVNTKPTLTVVPNETPAVAQAAVKTAPEVSQDAPASEAQPEAAAKVSPTTSLFG